MTENSGQNKGIVHKDKKCENIVLTEDVDVKLADFGFAAPIQGVDGSGKLHSCKGTKYYAAPELLLGKEYEGKSVDVFSCGITIFYIIFGSVPFGQALLTDYGYRKILENPTEFWAEFDQFFVASSDFKNLFESMIQIDPKKRFTIEQVMSSSWFNGKTPSFGEVKSEFESRRKHINEERMNAIKTQFHGASISTTESCEKVPEYVEVICELTFNSR